MLSYQIVDLNINEDNKTHIHIHKSIWEKLFIFSSIILFQALHKHIIIILFLLGLCVDKLIFQFETILPSLSAYSQNWKISNKLLKSTYSNVTTKTYWKIKNEIVLFLFFIGKIKRGKNRFLHSFLLLLLLFIILVISAKIFLLLFDDCHSPRSTEFINSAHEFVMVVHHRWGLLFPLR